MIYPVDSVIHLSSNRGLFSRGSIRVFNDLEGTVLGTAVLINFFVFCQEVQIPKSFSGW